MPDREIGMASVPVIKQDPLKKRHMKLIGQGYMGPEKFKVFLMLPDNSPLVQLGEHKYIIPMGKLVQGIIMTILEKEKGLVVTEIPRLELPT